MKDQLAEAYKAGWLAGREEGELRTAKHVREVIKDLRERLEQTDQMLAGFIEEKENV